MFNVALVQPLFNGLIIIYNYLPWQDIGIATVVLTIVIRLLFYPLYHKATASQIKINELQPKIKEIQAKYKKNFKEKAGALQNLYKENNVSPIGSIFLLLIQLPIMFALYKVFMEGFEAERLSALLYPFVDNPGIINMNFINIIDISQKSMVLAVITAIIQFVQTKAIMPKEVKSASSGHVAGGGGVKPDQLNFGEEIGRIMTKQMLYVAPLLTLLILSGLPSVLAIYWSTNSLVSIVQQFFIKKSIDKQKEEL